MFVCGRMNMVCVSAILVSSFPCVTFFWLFLLSVKQTQRDGSLAGPLLMDIALNV